MRDRFGDGIKLAIVFLLSLLVGYWLSGREDGGERVRERFLANFVGSLGMAIGYLLGREESGSQ